jgi:hypothetical protein
MKKWTAFLFVFIILILTKSNAQSYPHITEVRGLEDSLANTHLFYRYIYPTTNCWSKSIYHYDLFTNEDTLFIPDFGYEVLPGWGCEGDYVYDYEFFNNDPAKFIYCGYNLWIDPVALLRRYDGDIQIEAFVLTELEISKLDESLVYVSAGPGFFKSTDGGYNFEFNDSVQFIDASIISISKYDDSQIYGINDSKLVRSENDGLSYVIVDNSFWKDDSELFYDNDESHIYGLSVAYNFSTQSYSSKIYVSDDHGNPFTWNNILEYQGKSWFTIDKNLSGEIYYSAGKRIFKSMDFGSTFYQYKELERKITGLYKKSGSNILYASTPLKIYEITPDTIQIIKSLPIPEDAFAWLPLNQGDMWVRYHELIDFLGDSSKWISRSEVVGYKILDNKVYNKVLETIIHIDSLNSYGTSLNYFRVDSTNGIIYRSFFINDSLLDFESFLMDLMVEVGDTIPYGYGLYLVSEEPYTQFGVNSSKRIFQTVPPTGQQIELVKGFGAVSDSMWQPSDYIGILKGCVINGIVYGDTTVVSVEDENEPVAPSFKLEQNYPNPFNNSTVITYSIPQEGLVTLKVYNLLGEEVARIVNDIKQTGNYEVSFDATGLPSGIYFYRLQAGSFVETKKMVFLK